MNTPCILSIQIGKPKIIGGENASDPFDRTWTTGFYKEPVEGKVWLGKCNLSGDGQADLKNHGGPEKALLVHWLKILNNYWIKCADC